MKSQQKSASPVTTPRTVATPRNRREFLSSVGQGMLVASLGAHLAGDLGLGCSAAFGEEPNGSLSFGPLEPLVVLMQETPLERLLPTLVERINQGTELQTLVAAAALANARTFGGEDYIGFHTMMALAPAYHMSQELPAARRPLPVLKVLYRNTSRIHEHGGRSSEVLHPVSAKPSSSEVTTAETLRAKVREKNVDEAERAFAALAQKSPNEAFNDLLYMVEDHAEVHRVVMPYRAWDLLSLVGPEHAHTLLRQSVRYCVQNERSGDRRYDEPRELLPRVLESHHLIDRSPGDRVPDDAWVEELSKTIFNGSPTEAAEATAAALAEGFSPTSVGEAISLAANQLVLRDPGRLPQNESPGKPIGSVHGDSVGVHGCDSANAWRNMSRVGNPRNVFACLILGAYQVARDRAFGPSDLLKSNLVPTERQLGRVSGQDPGALLRELDESIRGNLQAQATAVTHAYLQLGHAPRPVFDLLLGYAISEDGALHGEKYYRTVSEEFAATRPAFRSRQLAALARVTASEYGRKAAGCDEARGLLKLV